MLGFTLQIRMFYELVFDLFAGHRRCFAAFAMLLLLIVPAIAQEPEQGDPVAVFNQAQDAHEKGDLVGAIKLYERALKIEPAFPEAEYQRGIAWLALAKPAEAEKAFRRAVELRPDWTMPTTSLGSLLLDRGELAEAEELLAKAVELEPQNAVALSALTELRLRSKAPAAQLESLLAKISALTGKANETPALWSARSALEAALKKNSAAKASIARTLEIDPKSRPAMFLLAEIALAEGDLDKAADLIARLSSQADDRLKVLRAGVLAAEGKPDAAIAVLDSVQKNTPAATDLRNRINAGKSTGTAELEKQLDKDPRNASVLGRLCMLFRRENPEKALIYCRMASEAEPSDPRHAVGFGAALVQAKQFESAVGVFRKILEIVPDNFTAHANLASALFQLKRFAEAKAEFNWMTNAQPRSAGAYLFLGIIHDEAGELMDAMANYQQYLRLADPTANRLDIDKVNLRLPQLQKLLKDGKSKKKW